MEKDADKGVAIDSRSFMKSAAEHSHEQHRSSLSIVEYRVAS